MSIQAEPMPATWDVIIFDRYHHGEPDGEFLIEGFPSRELAREYATRRVRDSIEELRTADQSEEEIRKLWNAYGESACAVGDDRLFPNPPPGCCLGSAWSDSPPSGGARTRAALRRRGPRERRPHHHATIKS